MFTSSHISKDYKVLTTINNAEVTMILDTRAGIIKSVRKHGLRN